VTADDVIELRNTWRSYNYAAMLPEAIVLATSDWIAYVMAMMSALPDDPNITYPSEEEINWAWPDGVLIVPAEPVDLDHTIISKDTLAGGRTNTPPHHEHQAMAGLVVAPLTEVATSTRHDYVPDNMRPARDGERPELMSVHPTLFIGSTPSDVVTGFWLPGGVTHSMTGTPIAESTKFVIAAVTALGHRLTRLDDPTTRGRGERRRMERELPGLRMLSLATGASQTLAQAQRTVAWSHRWMVRGHWRLQPYGAERKLRRLKWIDPYVKGPEDKPLDTRSTIWRTSAPH